MDKSSMRFFLAATLILLYHLLATKAAREEVDDGNPPSNLIISSEVDDSSNNLDAVPPPDETWEDNEEVNEEPETHDMFERRGSGGGGGRKKKCGSRKCRSGHTCRRRCRSKCVRRKHSSSVHEETCAGNKTGKLGEKCEILYELVNTTMTVVNPCCSGNCKESQCCMADANDCTAETANLCCSKSCSKDKKCCVPTLAYCTLNGPKGEIMTKEEAGKACCGGNCVGNACCLTKTATLGMRANCTANSECCNDNCAEFVPEAPQKTCCVPSDLKSFCGFTTDCCSGGCMSSTSVCCGLMGATCTTANQGTDCCSRMCNGDSGKCCLADKNTSNCVKDDDCCSGSCGMYKAGKKNTMCCLKGNGKLGYDEICTKPEDCCAGICNGMKEIGGKNETVCSKK